MKKLRELLRLKFHAQLKHREIGRALNISPGTVSYYIQAAKAVKLTWPLPATMSDTELNELIEPMAKQLRKNPIKRTVPDWENIRRALAQKHMTLMLLWEEYAQTHHTCAYSYAQFTRHYKAWCKKQRVAMRLEHKAGEKGFIDYAGTTIPVYSRDTGEIDFQAQLFVMALGASHYTFAHASRSQSLPDWIDSHQRAFRFFQGVPLILVPDNLKSGITDSCQFEPEANPTYAELAEHYNTSIIPARPRTPQDKSIGENAVLVSSRWIIVRLSKQKFYSLEALNNAIAQLLSALNSKPFQKRQGSRLEQFIELEKSQLIPLPNAPYEFVTLKKQTVPSDYHLRIEGHYYSVPYTLVGQTVLCRYNQTTVEVLHNNQRKASHLRSFHRDKKTTVTEHMPKAHREYQQWTPQVFSDWAKKTGDGVFNVTQQFIHSKRRPEYCSKIHFGLKQLCKQFGQKRLNKACSRAIALECVSFKSIRSILKNGLDQLPYLCAVSTQASALHGNIRGAQYYQKP